MQKNDIIYYIENYTDAVTKGIILSVENDTVKIKSICAVDRQGNNYVSTPGTTWRRISDCYTSVDSIYAAQDNANKEAVNGYCSEIKDIKDLARFPLQHCLNGEEYTNWNAVKAYKIRAKELLNIEL